METTWIVTADSSRARILQVADREQRLTQIEEMANPAGRLHERDMTTDAEPRFSGHGGVGKPASRTTGGPGNDREAQGVADHSIAVFARKIGQYLEQARQQHRFDRLLLVAPPKFLGQLRGELTKETEKALEREIDKDLSWFDAREIERYLARPER